MADKEEAARLAFDAWMERTYGVKGLSKDATVHYNPKGAYGDVYGSMDLSSENDLVKAVLASYLGWFEKNVDFFGNEGFPFSITFARSAREKGLRGILGEFTMQHLAPGELDAYLKSKLFNGIVFFGYTDGGTAAGAAYSQYASRPDVYEHQRWVFRRIVPLSRAAQRAGRQQDPAARLASGATPENAEAAATGVQTNPEGKVKEVKGAEAALDRITGRSPSTPPAVIRFGSDIGKGIYLYVDSGGPEEVACQARKLGMRPDTIVYDEFSRRILEARRAGDTLTFRTQAGPDLVKLGSREVLVRSLLERAAEALRQQVTQRSLDREMGEKLSNKVWARFCRAATWDTTTARGGKGSLKVEGDVHTGGMPQWKYFNRQGVAQLVSLYQTAPEPIIARAYSKAVNVPQSDEVRLDSAAARRKHFDARQGHIYALHLYLDYQDGAWPEVHTATFSAGTHDWEEKSIRVEPTRPVKSAMVLLEFHQPEGIAWFDDVSLSTGGGQPDGNLLAFPGFEADDPAAAQAQALGIEYEPRVHALLDSVTAASRSASPLRLLTSLREQVDALAAWLRDRGAAPYFGRELRDLDSVREALDQWRKDTRTERPMRPNRR